MIHTTIKRSGRPLVPYLTLCVFLVFILSCSGGSGDSSDSGSIALALKFQEVGDATLAEMQPAQAEEFCNDHNLDRIEAEIYDENGIEIASGSWPCYVGEGEITGVKAGPNRKVEVFGRDPSGSIIYEGETEEPINVVAGGMAYAEIELKNLNWYKTLGTDPEEDAYGEGIGIDSDRNCYITGYIENQGDEDIFISKYDKYGNLKWTQLLGSPGNDIPWGGIAVDSNGNCYITGYTTGDLAGTQDGDDIFVAKYDKDGKLGWIDQFGTPYNDYGNAIAIDSSGNCYITGRTQGLLPNSSGEYQDGDDIFVAKYDKDGDLKWIDQFGSDADEQAGAITVDSGGNYYISGHTEGKLPNSTGEYQYGNDIFVAKYDKDRKLKWIDQFGTSADEYNQGGIVVDKEGNCYITGPTSGDLDIEKHEENINKGFEDVYVSKYDANGNRLWTRLFGTPEDDRSLDMALDLETNLYITGYTAGDLAGINQGEEDIFVAKYDKNGIEKRVNQSGTLGRDFGEGIAVDWIGNFYITGPASGDVFTWKGRLD